MIAAAGLVPAAVFVCAAAPQPAFDGATTGPGRCVIALGDDERPCRSLRLRGEGGRLRLEADADGGGLALAGELAGTPEGMTVRSIDYGGAVGAPAEGTCIFELAAGRTLGAVDCDTFSAYGQIRLRFAAAPGS